MFEQIIMAAAVISLCIGIASWLSQIQIPWGCCVLLLIGCAIMLHQEILMCMFAVKYIFVDLLGVTLNDIIGWTVILIVGAIIVAVKVHEDNEQ